MDTNLSIPLLDILQYGFMQRALLAGTFIAGTCGVLGLFLVLRRFSMIGDGLAHVSFGVIGLALFLGMAPLQLAVPLVVAASWLILWLSRTAMHGDAAIGILSAVGVAVGVLFASIGGGFNVDLFGYLFGDILAVTRVETIGAVILSLLVLGVTILFYSDLFAVTFDPDNARALGIRVPLIEHILLVAASITVVLGIKVVGTMLVSSLLVFPAVTALQVARGFRSALILSALQAITSVIAGVMAAFWFDLPAGATIVLINLACFMAALALSRLFRW